MTALLKDLAHEVSSLVRKEGALARSELSEKLGQVGSGATELGVGALVAFAGLLILLEAAVYALALVVKPMWVAAALVGGVVMLIGLILLARARSNLRARNLTPDRTAEQVSRDAALVREVSDRADPRVHHDGPVTSRPSDDGAQRAAVEKTGERY